MSDNNSGNGVLYFIVGALCVAVVVGAIVMSGGIPSGTNQAQAPAASAPTETKNITIEKKTVEPERKVIIERK